MMNQITGGAKTASSQVSGRSDMLTGVPDSTGALAMTLSELVDEAYGLEERLGVLCCTVDGQLPVSAPRPDFGGSVRACTDYIAIALNNIRERVCLLEKSLRG